LPRRFNVDDKACKLLRPLIVGTPWLRSAAGSYAAPIAIVQGMIFNNSAWGGADL
jgi:hypothetical protein